MHFVAFVRQELEVKFCFYFLSGGAGYFLYEINWLKSAKESFGEQSVMGEKYKQRETLQKSSRSQGFAGVGKLSQGMFQREQK